MFTPREVIQSGFSVLSAGMSVIEKIAAIAEVVETAGLGDRVTTRMIRRQLVMTGRA